MVAGTVAFAFVSVEVSVMQVSRVVPFRPRASSRGSQLQSSQLRKALIAASVEPCTRPDGFHFEGEPPMSAQPQLKPDLDEAEDRQLANDIARAMHYRPLMSRLSRVDS